MSVVPRITEDISVSRHKWETVRYAVDDTARTVRLVIIVLAMGVAASFPFVVVMLAHAWLR